MLALFPTWVITFPTLSRKHTHVQLQQVACLLGGLVRCANSDDGTPDYFQMIEQPRRFSHQRSTRVVIIQARKLRSRIAGQCAPEMCIRRGGFLVGGGYSRWHGSYRPPHCRDELAGRRSKARDFVGEWKVLTLRPPYSGDEISYMPLFAWTTSIGWGWLQLRIDGVPIWSQTRFPSQPHSPGPEAAHD